MRYALIPDCRLLKSPTAPDNRLLTGCPAVFRWCSYPLSWWPRMHAYWNFHIMPHRTDFLIFHYCPPKNAIPVHPDSTPVSRCFHCCRSVQKQCRIHHFQKCRWWPLYRSCENLLIRHFLYWRYKKTPKRCYSKTSTVILCRLPSLSSYMLCFS